MKKVLSSIDLRDALLVVGVVCFIGGIAHFSWAIAAIVFGIMCILVALRPAKAQAEATSTGRLRITERQS